VTGLVLTYSHINKMKFVTNHGSTTFQRRAKEDVLFEASNPSQPS
jgi:hypothetical protein